MDCMINPPKEGDESYPLFLKVDIVLHLDIIIIRKETIYKYCWFSLGKECSSWLTERAFKDGCRSIWFNRWHQVQWNNGSNVCFSTNPYTKESCWKSQGKLLTRAVFGLFLIDMLSIVLFYLLLVTWPRTRLLLLYGIAWDYGSMCVAWQWVWSKRWDISF